MCPGTPPQKHAYIILAHHRPDLLGELLAALDDARNDIFLHIDAKAGEEMRADRFSTQRARLCFLPRESVAWADSSLVSTQLRAIRTAVEQGPHASYHYLTGTSYPIKSQDFIHRFFVKYPDRELITFDRPIGQERIRYYWLFSKSGKAINSSLGKRFLRGLFLRIQKLLGVDRFRKYNMEYKKGLSFWSISQSFAEYVIANEALIRKMVAHTFAPEELWPQILVWNSPFRDRVFDIDDQHRGSMIETTWPLEDAGLVRESHSFLLEDLDILKNSAALFALKFEGQDGPELIGEIKKWIL